MFFCDPEQEREISLWKFFSNPIGVFLLQFSHDNHFVSRIAGWRLAMWCNMTSFGQPGGLVRAENVCRNIVLIPEVFKVKFQQPQRYKQQD